MAKRKAGVKDIIYELDNDDIEISSDDEVKESKKGRFKDENNKKTYENKIISDRKCIEVISLDSPDYSFAENETQNKTNNGGKNCSETTSVKNNSFKTNDSNNVQERQTESVTTKNSDDDCLNTIIFDEDMVLESPSSNSDCGVVGCENRTPLISVRFNDCNLARVHKKIIKDFIINLLKSRTEETENECNESDNELDIWPEDLLDEEGKKEDAVAENDSLFFVDTEPCEDEKYIEVPKYSQNAPVISNAVEEENPPETSRRRHTCFNCDGDHQLRDCTLPRNNQRIAEKRKTIPQRMGRYHVEDDQKYGHLTPGRISSTLRNALGLKRYELPLHVYRMRLLGYPPGWLEEARISHSGITLFDSTGNATLEPDEEEGEVSEPGSKDKFDIKKILDFPGFNVPASSQYVEEGHLLGIPPMSEQDSKMIMLQNLAPNAVKAYKRKKLLLFPSSNNNSLQGQAEMELDSGDETTEFPSNPPLPDDEPPPAVPPPPPPPSPPPSPGDKEVKSNSHDKTLNITKKTNSIDSSSKSPSSKTGKNKGNEEDTSDVEVIEVLQVNDIPVPEDDLITIDEDYDSPSQLSSGRGSPTLDDLEKRKLSLLNALKSAATPEFDSSTIDLSESVESVEVVSDVEIDELPESAAKERNDNKKIDESKDGPKEGKTTDIGEEVANSVEVEITSISSTEQIENGQDNKDDKVNESSSNANKPTEMDNELEPPDNNATDAVKLEPKDITPTTSEAMEAKTPDVKTGYVKTTHYGTPVINVASSYVKLPSEDKFAKDICDVINFENLPNSTGKFKQISSLLKKVKTVVDRIHES